MSIQAVEIYEAADRLIAIEDLEKTPAHPHRSYATKTSSRFLVWDCHHVVGEQRSYNESGVLVEKKKVVELYGRCIFEAAIIEAARYFIFHSVRDQLRTTIEELQRKLAPYQTELDRLLRDPTMTQFKTTLEDLQND